MSGPSRQPHSTQGQGQGYPPPPPNPRSSLPSFPLPSLDMHQQSYARPPMSMTIPSASEADDPSGRMNVNMGLQSFAASPEEWDGGELQTVQPGTGTGPGSPGRYTSKWEREFTPDKKPVATRRRVVQSCSECRRRKIKCDKKWVCLRELSEGMH